MLNDAYALSFEQAIEEEARSQTINSLARGESRASKAPETGTLSC